MFSRFEIASIGISVVFMALALYMLRLEGSLNPNVDSVPTASQPTAGIVVVPESNDQQAALASAITEAADARGQLEDLIIDDVVIGTGPLVADGDTVTVHYIGTLQNGQEFDNSRSRGAPFTFTVGSDSVIEGWERGVIGMQPGGERILVIPPELGYGRAGYGPIPGNATLVFAIELISID